MARHRVSYFDRVLEALEAGASPKAIQYDLKVPYQQVINLKNKFFDTVLVPKERVPDPKQGSFFSHYWADR